MDFLPQREEIAPTACENKAICTVLSCLCRIAHFVARPIPIHLHAEVGGGSRRTLNVTRSEVAFDPAKRHILLLFVPMYDRSERRHRPARCKLAERSESGGPLSVVTRCASRCCRRAPRRQVQGGGGATLVSVPQVPSCFPSPTFCELANGMSCAPGPERGKMGRILGHLMADSTLGLCKRHIRAG